jgi:hypothetical protein
MIAVTRQGRVNHQRNATLAKGLLSLARVRASWDRRAGRSTGVPGGRGLSGHPSPAQATQPFELRSPLFGLIRYFAPVACRP